MAVTVLNDVFPPRLVLAAGIRGKQERRNSRVEVDSGESFVNQVWTQTRRQYEIGFVPMRLEGWEAITALHEVTAGGAKGFLLEDPIDHTATTANGRMELVGGSIYQLHKRYSVASRTEDRKITRPKASGFVPYYDGVAIETYTLDVDTGRITLAAPVADASLLSWSGRFYVPVHFLDDFLDWNLAAPGSVEQRFVAGPSTILQEVRE